MERQINSRPGGVEQSSIQRSWTGHIPRRSVQDFLGESQFDDANIKDMVRLITLELETLTQSKDIQQIFYSQGVVATLTKVINKLRESNRKSHVEDID